MGKGFNNFMSKKAFHPGSFQNRKKIHEAEARAEAKRKHDEETFAQYQKEQELFNQNSLISRESKEKLSLNFMYDAPPGVEKNSDRKSGNPNWKGTGSNGIGNYHPIKHEKDAGDDDIIGVSLDWKRDRPVRNSNQAKRAQEALDKELKRENESQADLKPKIESLEKPKASHSSSRRREDHNRDTKRVKKES